MFVFIVATLALTPSDPATITTSAFSLQVQVPVLLSLYDFVYVMAITLCGSGCCYNSYDYDIFRTPNRTLAIHKKNPNSFLDETAVV